MSIASIYNIIRKVQNEYKKENSVLYLGDATLQLLTDRVSEISSTVLKDEYEHLRWYNTIDAKDHNDILIYHHLSLLGEAWKLLEETGKKPGITREEIVRVLTELLETEVSCLKNTKDKSDGGIKKELIGSIYYLLQEFNPTTKEMQVIDRILDRYIKTAR